MKLPSLTRQQGLALAGGAALLAWMAWAFQPEPLAVEVATVASGRFEQTIAEDGKTRLRERYVVAAPLAGQLARLPWHEGDVVQAGQVLAHITPVAPTLLDARSRQQQQAQLEAAQANAQRAAATLARARAALTQAQADERRSQQLAAQGFAPPTQAEATRLARTLAEQDTAAALSAQRAAQAEVQAAHAALAWQEGASTGTPWRVRAPVAGRVLKVVQPSSTPVALGTALLELGDTTSLEVVAELLTPDAVQTPPGAPVRIERWGGAGLLAGRVRAVEPAAFTKVSALGVEEQRVRVLIDLLGEPSQWAALGDGYRVGVHIVTRTQEAALLVPTSAVFPLAAARPGSAAASPAVAGAASAPGGGAAPAGVFLLEGGRVRLQPVTLGGRNASLAWVTQGLRSGQQVVVYPPAALADGTPVQVRSVPVR